MSAAEILFRFGSATPRRRSLALRVKRWIELCRAVQARRLLVAGSFVTAKPDPRDVDAVVLLPIDFEDQFRRGEEAAIELDAVTRTRRPEELFAAGDEVAWDRWVEFFGRARDTIGVRRGMVEVTL